MAADNDNAGADANSEMGIGFIKRGPVSPLQSQKTLSIAYGEASKKSALLAAKKRKDFIHLRRQIAAAKIHSSQSSADDPQKQARVAKLQKIERIAHNAYLRARHRSQKAKLADIASAVYLDVLQENDILMSEHNLRNPDHILKADLRYNCNLYIMKLQYRDALKTNARVAKEYTKARIAASKARKEANHTPADPRLGTHAEQLSNTVATLLDDVVRAKVRKLKIKGILKKAGVSFPKTGKFGKLKSRFAARKSKSASEVKE
ncbi:hypothetical protein BASA50_008783 [Batrachochytrium salamandrivorans]|uniref:Uncharacterized protein n=1 Tax=Batrachochytrium salamandrivorans TaxID=1357716 RepID=A0ABQ8F6C3_9FUNG|nr:hypothetical protein BASA62_007839 [Batrachochytrium salamandrivorans]KAH6591339.1 hypothetical protein BASA50_008783 [Batrachochytrium salamandrivorans]KAH6602369.1 hypothetical protein BASA61_001197 [Batrachochytrium salamandrivorans]KAH9248612.1 hypothetical protein BASA81_013725 [Batrachochytrium salamandrivorans]KAJ1342334.1 hypothetical protein BSLG_003093 [Batrachochytrium salamandrivorans]